MSEICVYYPRICPHCLVEHDRADYPSPLVDCNGWICGRCRRFITHYIGLSTMWWVATNFSWTPESEVEYPSMAERGDAINHLVFDDDMFRQYWLWFTRMPKQPYHQGVIADRVAVPFLLSLLDANSQRTLLQYGYILVRGSSGRPYMLVYERHGNVLHYDENNILSGAYCGHYGETLPIADTLLSQILVLQTDEDHYLKTANPVRPDHVGWCFPRDTYRSELRKAIEDYPEYLEIFEAAPDILAFPQTLCDGVEWMGQLGSTESQTFVSMPLGGDTHKLWVPENEPASGEYSTHTDLRAYGDPILRTRCKEIKNVKKNLSWLVPMAQGMASTMQGYGFVGLAANQVGHSIRLMVIRGPSNYPIMMINPELIEADREELSMEGCGSIPGIMCAVRRANVVRMRYTTIHGTIQERKFRDLEAYVCQHELDHLNGVMIVDRADYNLRWWHLPRRLESEAYGGIRDAMIKALDNLHDQEKEYGEWQGPPIPREILDANNAIRNHMMDGFIRDRQLRDYMESEEAARLAKLDDPGGAKAVKRLEDILREHNIQFTPPPKD